MPRYNTALVYVRGAKTATGKSDVFLRAEEWKNIFQLLKEQSEKMEDLGMALKINQDEILRNNPASFKSIVEEAAKVLDYYV